MALFKDKLAAVPTTIRSLSVRDIRFPTSLAHHDSDVKHKDPDYSCAYVVIFTDSDIEGHGLAFAFGAGTEIIVAAIKSLAGLLVGRKLRNIFQHFGEFWHEFTTDAQLRWLGPEKGVIHLASAAIINGLWDLWGKIEHKPLWKLLADMEPEVLVSTIDFTYITDVITPEEAVQLLKNKKDSRQERERLLHRRGYPAYMTEFGWHGSSDGHISELLQIAMTSGFQAFKLRIGENLDDDIKRCRLVRKIIGEKNILMLDANQRWEREEAVQWMKKLAEFRPLWIEEPTSPDDILNHAYIAKELEQLGIAVATGEHCCNRIMFKQFLTTGLVQYIQVDATRVGGINEALAVYLMAAKFGVAAIPHTGGVGLCEINQHLQMFDYLCVSGKMENRWIEYIEELHNHFKVPPKVENGCYWPPTTPGSSLEMIGESLMEYEYPYGQKWQELFESGKYTNPLRGLPSWVARSMSISVHK